MSCTYCQNITTYGCQHAPLEADLRLSGSAVLQILGAERRDFETVAHVYIVTNKGKQPENSTARS